MKARYLLPVLGVLLGVFFIKTFWGKASSTSTSATNHVRCHITSDPQTFHISATPTAVGYTIRGLIHQEVYTTLDDSTIVPVLAKAPYEVSADRLSYTVELHPDAKWEDGKPVTSEDVLFSLKTNICPLTVYAALVGYLEFLKSFEIISPSKFRLNMKSYYIQNDLFLSSFPIIDKRVYDPKNVLDKYQVTDFLDPKKTWESDSALTQFSRDFKGHNYHKDPKYIKGLGPYELISYKPGELVVLKKKANYWGKNRQVIPTRQDADSISFYIIKEEAAYEAAIQQNRIDYSSSLSINAFTKLSKDPNVQQKYDFIYKPRSIVTGAFFNLRPDGVKHPSYLKDLAVRKAIAHLVPMEELLKPYKKEFTQILTCVPSSYYQSNQNLKPYSYSPVIADSILKAAGWQDTDGDKILDKVIDGKKQKLSLTLTFSPVSATLTDMLTRTQQELQKSGIECNLNPVKQEELPRKWSAFDFDLIFTGYNPSVPFDFKDSFHSTCSGGNGSNYAGFGRPETDALIEKIRITFDKKQFKLLSDSLQKIIHEELPVLYFYTLKGRVLSSKTYTNADSLTIKNPALNTLRKKQ